MRLFNAAADHFIAAAIRGLELHTIQEVFSKLAELGLEEVVSGLCGDCSLCNEYAEFILADMAFFEEHLVLRYSPLLEAPQLLRLRHAKAIS